MNADDGTQLDRDVTTVETPPVGVDERPTASRPEMDVATASARQVHTTSRSRFAPDALIAAAVGVVLAVIGLIVIIRGGFSGPMSSPVVTVLGFTHTTTLGLLELGMGACLLISGAMKSRAGAMFFGGVLGVAGFVGAVQSSSFDTSLALETSMAWLAVIAGIVVVAAALLMPRFTNRSSTIHQGRSQR